MKFAGLITFGLLITASQAAFAGGTAIGLPCQKSLNYALGVLKQPLLTDPNVKFVQKSSGSVYNYAGMAQALSTKQDVESAEQIKIRSCLYLPTFERNQRIELQNFDSTQKRQVMDAYQIRQSEHRAALDRLEVCRATDDCSREDEDRLRRKVADLADAVEDLQFEVKKVENLRAGIEERNNLRITAEKTACDRATQEANRKIEDGKFVVCKTQACVDAVLNGQGRAYALNKPDYLRNLEEVETLKKILQTADDSKARKNISAEIADLEAANDRLVQADKPLVTFSVHKNDNEGSGGDEIRLHTRGDDIRIYASDCTIRRPFPCQSLIDHGLPTFRQCGLAADTADLGSAIKDLFSRSKKSDDDEGLR